MIQFSRIQLKDWELVLVDKYPLIFSEGAGEYKQYAPNEEPGNLINLRYGFECGSGWSKLIEDIASVGSALVTKMRESGHPDSFIHSCIVKEKFGTLRWQGDFNLPENFSKL